MSVLQDSVSLSEKVINNQSSVFSSICQLQDFGSVILDERVDLGRYRFIIDVDLCLPLSFCLVWLWSSPLTAALCWSLGAWLLSPEERTLAVWLQVHLPFSKVHESCSLGASCNSLVFLGFFGGDLHHSVVASTGSLLQVLIGNFGSNTQAID